MRTQTLGLGVAVVLIATAAAAARPDKVDAWLWGRASAAGATEALVLMAEQADVHAAAARATDRLARRRAVVDALRATAARTQADLRATLAERGVAHRSFLTVNALLVEADPAFLAELAARPEVGRIVGNPTVYPQPIITDEAVGEPSADDMNTTWGIEQIRAPELWALGHTGEGIVVGGQDTGVRWTHEAVIEHYRGWDGTSASHDFNWHDAIHVAAGANPCDVDAPEPCDDHGHGTHTIGTAAGGNTAEEIGVAPGARWIACRNMDEGAGTPARYIECFDWLLAPWPIGGDPASGDPALGADVTVNSWVCPDFEGCVWDSLLPAVQAHRAAGIFTAASAGNAGRSCGSVGAPPATYAEVFSVGASTTIDRVAGFSSRGPAADTNAMKPDVCAPGVGVRSATSEGDDTYASWGGTSMAGPHVAGAVALLWSAEPALRGDIDRTEELLERTAVPLRSTVESCGGDYAFGPNNSWGYGRIDVAQALAALNLPTVELDCTNGVDDDGDHFTDCADIDCAGHPSCPEAGNCLDLVDNDLDGTTDCQDTDCLGDPLCPERGNCGDGLDNDLDGDVDCDDRDCDFDPICPGLAMAAVQLITPTGLEPPLADVHAPGCRYPKWGLCPEAVTPGPLPGRMIGEAAPFAQPALRLYQHSDSGQVFYAEEAGDIVYEAR